MAHAVPLDADMGNGRLDLVQALQLVSPAARNTADFSLTVSPSENTINPGRSATYTVSVTRVEGSITRWCLVAQACPPGLPAR